MKFLEVVEKRSFFIKSRVGFKFGRRKKIGAKSETKFLEPGLGEPKYLPLKGASTVKYLWSCFLALPGTFLPLFPFFLLNLKLVVSITYRL